ncbi:MAG TPA: C39 family peptidase [Anaerolineae bacterium]|nr:C39 family peptidase [Anaerolineae bacterium]
MGSKQLNVPYHSQWDADAQDHITDCGPTSLSMVLNGFNITATTDGLYQHIRPRTATQYTNFLDLMKAGKVMGLQFEYWAADSEATAYAALKRYIDAGKPMIVLVNYRTWQKPTGNIFDGTHFVVVVGYDDSHIYINDPLFGGTRNVPRDNGDHFKMSYRVFMDGWGGLNGVNGNSDYSYIIPKKSMPTAVATPATPAPAAPASATPAVTTPTPVTVESEPVPTAVGEVPEMTAEVKRRIRALAAHVRSYPPDFDDPKDVKFWGERLGDYGAKTKTHVVGNGETFSSVAGKYYDDASAYRGIRSYNNITSKWLWVGQRLQIPLIGDTPLPTDAPLDPGAAAFSIGADPLGSQEAAEYTEVEKLNEGFSFSEGLEPGMSI